LVLAGYRIVRGMRTQHEIFGLKSQNYMVAQVYRSLISVFRYTQKLSRGDSQKVYLLELFLMVDHEVGCSDRCITGGMRNARSC